MSYKKTIQISCLALCLNMIYMYFTNNLKLYIHPRYELFSIIFVSIAVMLLVTNWIFSKEKEKNKLNIFGILIAILTAAAVLLPPTSLSERTASGRIQSSTKTVSQSQTTSYDNFSQDFTHFDIVDWTSLIATNPPDSQIVGKSARFIGFVFNNENNKYIARFRLSCCAVDATPLTIKLGTSPAIDNLAEGTWIEVIGIFEKKDSNFVLKVDSISQISEPEQPYVY